MPAIDWLVPLTLRSTAVLVVALALVAVLRRFPAMARHRVLTLTATSLLLLPALPGLLPRWELRLPAPVSLAPESPFVVSVPEPPGLVARDERAALVPLSHAPQAAPGVPAGSLALAFGTVVSGVWLVGVLASLAGLVRALLRERRLVASSRPLHGPWTETLAEVQVSLGLSRGVRLFTSEQIEAPVTGGWRRPVVLLPPEAALWSEEKRRVVLQHELVHAQRGDALRHLAWRAVVALYWFHPLARLAERTATLVGEHACDETVLDLGTRPSAYARHLMEIAESLGAEPRGLANALPMVDRSQLERRLFMILDPNRSPGRGRALAAVCLALLAGTVAAAGAARPTPAGDPPSQAKPAPATTAAKPAPSEGAKQRQEEVVVRAVDEPATPPRAAVPAEPGAACVGRMSGDFSGTYSEGPSGREWSGMQGGDFALQQNLGNGQRLCARVHGPVRFDERTGAIVELPSGSSVSVETRGRNRTRRVLVVPDSAGPRYEWWLDGAPRAADDAARAWLTDALEVIASYRAIGGIQGQVGSLQGEIGSIQGEVGSLQGKIGSVQGRIGSLQGQVGSIQGEEGSLQGEIGGHQGAIGGLEANRWDASAAEKARIDEKIAAHQAEIRKLQAEISSGQLARRLAEAEAELRAAEEKGQREIAAIERQIEDVHAEARISGLEKKIADLHAEDRIAEIERRMKPAVDRLKASL
jgi:beta-lactamase regulating signal transducer with metallopeptidase domain